MNNIVSIYKSIFGQIDTIMNNGVSMFKQRMVFNNNIKRMLDGKNYLPFNYPQCYVEVKFLNQKNLLDKYNAMDADIIFHILDQQFDAGDGSYDQNFEIFTYRDAIVKAFQLYFAPNCGPMAYLNEDMNFNHTNLYEYIVRFRCHYIDITAIDTPITATASIILDIDIESRGELEGVGNWKITYGWYDDHNFVIS